MSEQLSNSVENVEANRTTVPQEILDFEARLAEQQEALAAAQAGVDDLNFKSSAEDLVYAKGELRDAKAKYDDSMADLSDEWLRHGGERLENARMAVENLDFNSDASDRVKAQAELRDAEDAWRDSYNAENSDVDQAGEPTPESAVDAKAAEGIDKVNQMADEHIEAIDKHAEQASAEVRDNTEAAEAETSVESDKFDPDQAAEEARQRLSDEADRLEAKAQENFKNKAEADVETPKEESPEATNDEPESIEAAKAALEYMERPDEESVETDDKDSEETVESDNNEEFVEETESEDSAEKDSSEDAEDGEFVDDDEEENEEDKQRFGKIRSFISGMRKKAGVAYVKAYNSIMDGFGAIGGKLTARKEGELDEAYEKRKKTVGLLTVAVGATALAAANRLGGGDHFAGFEGFGSGDSGGAESTFGAGSDGSSESILGIDGAPDNIDTDGGADMGDVDHDNTPEVDGNDWNEAATTVDKGEGWYQTFEDMGIPKDEWSDLLQKVGPELKADGYAYTMPDGSYGISRPGQLPTEVLDMIEQNR